MSFVMSPEELVNENNLFHQCLNIVFDTYIIVDRNCVVIFCGDGVPKFSNRTKEQMLGQSIRKTDTNSPYEHVIKSGKPDLNSFCIIMGRKCIHSIYPVFWNNEVIGVIGVIMYENLDILSLKLAKDVHINKTAESEDVLARVQRNYVFLDFVGESPITQALISDCRKAALTKYPILILGESGTGKEILAGAIHSANLKQKFEPYIKINCTAIPNDLLESELFGYEKGAFTGAAASKKGKFEVAAGGTILLDEIGDMDMKLQSKLLRVLEDKEFERIGGVKPIPLNARIIASTNCNLYQKCLEGTFRLDLYYRLNIVEIKTPPLRERKADIPDLINHFLQLTNSNIVIQSDALDVMINYSWPGNVRELRNVITRLSIWYENCTVDADTIRTYLSVNYSDKQLLSNANNEINLPKTLASQKCVSEIITLNEAEKELIIAALKSESYHLSNTATVLGITRATLYNKMKKYNINLKSL